MPYLVHQIGITDRLDKALGIEPPMVTRGSICQHGCSENYREGSSTKQIQYMARTRTSNSIQKHIAQAVLSDQEIVSMETSTD